MAECGIEIAGIPVRVECRFESTPEYFRKYKTEAEPVETVSVSPEETAQEQKFLDLEAAQEGLRRRVFTEPFLERAVIQRKIAGIALQRSILLLHGSTIAVDGKAYLFTAKCGVGKSTHTRLWRQLLGDRAAVINDDRAFLKIGDGPVIAYGSPWSGKHGLDSNICAPLDGICILERGQENEIRPLSPEDALPALQAQLFLPEAGDSVRLSQLAKVLCASVPLWKMKCINDLSAAAAAYEAMIGK